jgi:hypothetical protein
LSFVSGKDSQDRKERLTIKANGEIRIAQPNHVLYYLIDGSTTPARSVIYGASSSSIYHTMNAYFDGSNWQRDDATKPAVVFSLDTGSATVLSRFRYASAGANPITPLTAWDVSTSGVFRANKIGSLTDGTSGLQITKADGTAVTTIDTTNSRVGIGTTAPSARLHINETSTTVGALKIDKPAGTTGEIAGMYIGSAKLFSVETYKWLARLSRIDWSTFDGLGRIDFVPDINTTGTFSVLHADRFGSATKDLFFQLQPQAGAWSFFETTGDQGLVISTSRNIPIVFTPNRTESARLSADGKLGVGTGETVSAKIHSLSTTEQLRLGYDANNFMSSTISSTGSATFNLTGTSPQFDYLKNVNVTGNITASTGYKVGASTGLSGTYQILKDVDLVGLTKTYCNQTFTGGILTNTTC